MNFFQKIKTGRLFSSHRKNDLPNIGTMPDVIIKFTFMGETYILEEFDLNFSQELNDKGQPGGLPRGGIMTLTISETPSYSLNDWILRGDLLRNGEIRFLSNDKSINDGALLIIGFVDAYCIGYEKGIHVQNGGLSTTFTISPRYVRIGNEEFTNRWKESEKYTHNIDIYSLDKE